MSNRKVIAMTAHTRRAERAEIVAEWQLAISEFRAKLEQLEARIQRLEAGSQSPSLSG